MFKLHTPDYLYACPQTKTPNLALEIAMQLTDFQKYISDKIKHERAEQKSIDETDPEELYRAYLKLKLLAGYYKHKATKTT